MAEIQWHVLDAWNADNPTPGLGPPRITYISYAAGGIGARVIRIDNPAPDLAAVAQMIEADINFQDVYKDLKGKVTKPA